MERSPPGRGAQRPLCRQAATASAWEVPRGIGESTREAKKRGAERARVRAVQGSRRAAATRQHARLCDAPRDEDTRRRRKRRGALAGARKFR